MKGAYIIEYVSHEEKDGLVTKVYAKILEGTKSGQESGVKVKGVIHWVNADNAADAEVYNFDYLLLPDDGTKKDFSERINPDSKKVFHAKIEPCLLDAKAGEGYQFMRSGYYCRDIKDAKPGIPAFNRIVGLKDTYKP